MRCSVKHMLGRAVALSCLAMVAVFACGCSVLGIQDPNAVVQTQDQSGTSANTTDFDKLMITPNLDTNSWTWVVIDDSNNPLNGNIVMGVPVHVENHDDGSRVVSDLYCKLMNPDGTPAQNLSRYYDNDLLGIGNIGVGGVRDTTLHILYQGSGAYTLQCDNLLGSKAEMTITVDALGVRALPSALNATNASRAIPAGTPFDAEGLTITLSPDPSTYVWSVVSYPENDYWNGITCVGVPVTVVNHDTAAHAITQSCYYKYTPWYSMGSDPAPFFPSDIAMYGDIQPGATVTAWMYFVYDSGDGNYYLAMDNGGRTVVASVNISL